MVKGILCDNDVRGQFGILIGVLHAEPWQEFWASLSLQVLYLEDIGLTIDSSDLVIWQETQRRELVLVTANRSMHSPDSLEATLQTRNTPACLPVMTLADPQRLLRDKAYAERTAARLLDYLLRIEEFRGTGRMYIP